MCIVQAWENGIGKGSTRIRRKNFEGRTYQLGQVGNGVTSVRVTGNRCKIQFKDKDGMSDENNNLHPIRQFPSYGTTEM